MISPDVAVLLYRFIRYDPIEGTARLSKGSAMRVLYAVSLGTTRLRVLQVFFRSSSNSRRDVSLGTTRLRVLQDYSFLPFSGILTVSLGTTRLRVLQVSIHSGLRQEHVSFH